MEILDKLDIEDEKLKDWEAYIGKSAGYYVRKWQEIEKGHYFSINIAAIIFNIFWFLYRKMYIELLVFFLGLFFLAEASLLFEGSRYFIVLSNAILLLYLFSFVITTNWLYYRKATREIAAIKKQKEIDYESAITTKGGTALLMVFVAIIAFLAISPFLGFLLLGLAEIF